VPAIWNRVTEADNPKKGGAANKQGGCLQEKLTIRLQILSWGYTATAVVEVQYNFYGQHVGKSDAYHLEEFSKGLYGLAIVYPLALTFSNLSLLALYWRISG